jgi:peptide/nickel transport system permease protein
MIKLILYRLLQGIFVLLLISLLIFALLARAGGDVVTANHHPQLSQETIEGLRRLYGLDRPLYERYGRWVAHAARGDLGHSLTLNATVWSLIRPRLGHTAALAAVALMIAWSVSLALGIAAARRAGSWLDRFSSGIILLSASIPKIALALLTLILIGGAPQFISAGLAPGASDDVWSFRILLPAIILAVPLIATFLAQTRVVVGDALKEDFVQVARAKGASETVILLRHALRPALNPLITIFGYSLGGVMSGSVIVERILGWRGLGALGVEAVFSRDIPLVLGVTMIVAAAVLTSNLVADILLRLSNPRLREGSNAPDEMA